MLTDYIPNLPNVVGKIEGEVPRIPDAIKEELRKAVLLRNGVAHTGKDVVDSDRATKTLLAVWDVLWLCDFYVGHAWAAKFLGIATKRALGLPTDWDYRWISVND